MLSALIGKKVRRITFSLYTEGKLHLIFAIIEDLLSDMQDYGFAKQDEFVIKRAGKSKPKSKDKVYFFVDWFEVSREFIENPTENFILNDGENTRILCDGKYHRYVDRIEDVAKTTDLFKCFPLRKTARHITVWADTSCHMLPKIMDDRYFKEQYSQLSEEHYGIDLSLYPEFIGNINIIGYNSYFRSIDWSISNDPPGIYAVVNQRVRDGTLQIEFINKDKNGLFEYSATRELDLSSRYHFWELPCVPDCLTILVKDAGNNLVYACGDMSFIRSFSVGMNVHSRTVSLEHRGGDRETIEKFTTENFSVGEPHYDDILLTSATQAYQLLENSLEFSFFNGSKDEAERMQNRVRAKGFVRKIIARASRRCIIADPYFNLDDLSGFVFTMPQSDVTVRIISAQEFLNSKFCLANSAEARMAEADAIRCNIKTFCEKTGGNIQFRLLSGTCMLHDRYIVVDDDVWLIGTSFNEIGSRACTIVKLPQVSCRPIINMLDGWWNDSAKTISLEDYVNS